jgi:hypothetical protein
VWYLETVVKEQSRHDHERALIIDRVLVIERSTGNIVKVLGERLGLDEYLAKGVTLAAAVLSSVGENVGARLVSFEVRYSSKLVSVEVDGKNLRVEISST